MVAKFEPTIGRHQPHHKIGDGVRQVGRLHETARRMDVFRRGEVQQAQRLASVVDFGEPAAVRRVGVAHLKRREVPVDRRERHRPARRLRELATDGRDQRLGVLKKGRHKAPRFEVCQGELRSRFRRASGRGTG